MEDDNLLTILQYNMHISKDLCMAPFFKDEINQNYGIIAVQEQWTWTSKDTGTEMTHHPCSDIYELVYPDKGHARACFFVHKERLPPDKWFCRVHSPDFLSLNVKYVEQGEEKRLWVHNVYRQPDNTDPTRTLDQLDSALAEPGDHLVVGDFNLHHPHWGGVAEFRKDQHAHLLLETMDKWELELLLPQGTTTRRMQGSNTTIDLVLATPGAAERYEYCDIWEQAEHCSDHRPILTTLRINIPKAPTRKVLKWASFDKGKFIETLKDRLPTRPEVIQMVESDRTEFALGRITTAIQEAIGTSVPLARISKWSKPGFTSEIKELIQRVKRLRRKWQGTQDPDDWEEYCIARNHKGREIKKRLTEIHRENVERASTDPKGLWKLAKWVKNRGTRRQNYTPPLDKGDGTKEDTPEGKARLLHEAFFPTPPAPDLTDIETYEYPEPLPFPEITRSEMRKAVARLRSGKAPGADGIPNQALKAGAELLIPLWLIIMNDAMRRGLHPQAWKSSITVALRKPGKGDYSQPKSYRPIALLNTMGKLMESILATRMNYWMEEFHLIPEDHIGGRKMRGVESAVHLLLERIYAGFKNTGPVASLLMLDVSGAFDNVSHQRLLHNLRKRRVPGEVVRWIEGFLAERTTTIRMPEYAAEPATTATGIPQGSPLSPILYLFYNADLVQELGSFSPFLDAIGYIDDVGILVTGNSTEDNCNLLRKAYEEVAKPWAAKHASVFAPTKFAVQHFALDNKIKVDTPLTIDDATTVPEQSIRVLGVHLDPRLSFIPHMRHIEAKAGQRIGAMRAIAGSTWGMSLANMRRLYIGAMRPLMMFGSSIWYTPCHNSRNKVRDNRKLQILTALQKRAAAVITGAFKVTAGHALDLEIYIEPVPVYLQRVNGEAMVRITRSPIIDYIRLARPPGGGFLRSKQVKYKSPLERLENHYGDWFATALEDNSPVSMELERVLPWVAPPWWEGATTWIAGTKDEAVTRHDIIGQLTEVPGAHHVYTDGSGYRGHVGAAAATRWHGRPVVQKAYMGDQHMSTVYAAELKGIELALDFGLDGYTMEICHELHIWTDNQAAIRAIADPNGCASGQYILRDIIPKIDSLRATGVKVAIRWIPAHVGVDGNERADKAAKEACTDSCRPLTHISYLAATWKQLLRNATREHWNWAWDTAKHGGAMRRWNPVPTMRTLDCHEVLSKAQSAVWVQLRAGKIALKKYLFDIGRADTPTCDRCGTSASQTVRHVLLECPRLKDQRPPFLSTCTDLRKVLTDPRNAYSVTKFMITERLLGQFLNVKVPDLPEGALDNEGKGRSKASRHVSKGEARMAMDPATRFQQVGDDAFLPIYGPDPDPQPLATRAPTSIFERPWYEVEWERTVAACAREVEAQQAQANEAEAFLNTLAVELPALNH